VISTGHTQYSRCNATKATAPKLSVEIDSSHASYEEMQIDLKHDPENILNTLLAKIIAVGRAIGPYAAIELLLPGGSLITLLFWIYRTYSQQTALVLGDPVSP
jgi:hypothetical protein